MSTIEKALKKKAQEGSKDEQENASVIEKAQQKASLKKENQHAEPAQEKVAAPLETKQQADSSSKPSKQDSNKNSEDFVEPQMSDVEIDLEDLEQRGFVSVDNTRRLINEEYRAIKRKLLKNAFGSISSTLNNSNIIMVSSARPGEGKTFSAINLALSIAAEKDKTVLLVDADVLRPNVSKTLKISPKDGLMEYLLDEKHDIADVMYKTNIEKLRIIPAGRSHHLSTELLASQKMHDTINEIASRYSDRVVIIDTPPLIGINETAILTSFAGQAVVVTVEGKSRIADITKATSQLNPEMAIGFLVNKAIVSVDEEQGYYGYYYAN